MGMHTLKTDFTNPNTRAAMSADMPEVRLEPLYRKEVPLEEYRRRLMESGKVPGHCLMLN